MYNYGRTLLLNLTGNDRYFANVPGDELIPSAYSQLELPNYLRNLRSVLLGATPDRAMLNYRAAQLLELIAATELQQYILELDPRITYSSYQLQLAAPVTFQATSPDASGVSGYDYRVAVDGVNINIQRLTTPVETAQHVLSFTSGLSPPYSLPGSDYTVRVNTADLAGGWTVRGYLRPTVTLNELASEIQNLSEATFFQLFGVTDVEPYLTFKNCWNNHPELAYQLGGLVLAMLYRTQELVNA
jgi:hypothetical protein